MTSNYVAFRDFGFALPSGSTIQGIQVAYFVGIYQANGKEILKE